MNNQKTTYIAAACVLCLIVWVYAAENEQPLSDSTNWKNFYTKGCNHYQNKEWQMAADAFKDAFKTAFPDVSAKPVNDDEKKRLELFYDEKTAVLSRYQQGLYMLAEKKTDQAAKLFRDALTIHYHQDAVYLGYQDGCKSCHFKEWKSWKKTRMANAFDTLKPGGDAELVKKKIKAGLDPKADYTKDPVCLDCHTTGYGLPGGYIIPDKSVPYKIRKAAKQTFGVTCEVCHGPGGKYAPLHKDVEDNARPYRQQEFFMVGENNVKADVSVCTRCHNKNSPTIDEDFKFDFEKKLKEEGQLHEHFKLIYRIAPTRAKQQNPVKGQQEN